jgi:hypothetical protein
MSKELAQSNIAPVLADLAQRINTEHAAVGAAMKSGLEHALRAGELLFEAKASVDHGEWLPWLECNCDIAQRTAQAYMRLAREFPKLEPAKAQRVADLSFRDAIAELGKDTKALSELPEIRMDEALESAEAQGKQVIQVAKRAERTRQLVAEIKRPEMLMPAAGDAGARTFKLLANHEHHLITVVVGPNKAGAELAQNLEAVRQDDDYKGWQDDIDELKKRADALRAEADRLEREAKEETKTRNDSIAAELIVEHGPAYYFIETYDYALDDKAFKKLAEHLSPQAAIDYLRNNPQGVHFTDSGCWGDMRMSGWGNNGLGQRTFDYPRGCGQPLLKKLNEAARAGGGRPGWVGIGSPGWLHDVLGEDGLAPPNISDA